MAKEDKAKVKMTVIHFETESDNVTLQENIRAISHTLTRALTTGHRVIPPAAQLTSGNGSAEGVQDIEEQDVVDEDGFASPVASQTTKKKSAARQYPTPQAIDLDLMSGDMPLKKFLEEKNPDGDIKRYLVIAYWLRKYRKIEEVTMHHAYTCYRHMGTGWQVPPDAAAPLRAMKRKQYGWMKAGSTKGAYAINHLGENEVEQMPSA
jgi:hypothetical protein